MIMSNPGAVRSQRDLADMVEMLLDKGVVVNADIVVTIGETELLGIQVRAAIASFETAAKYGLEFPEGTDMERVEAAASGRSSLAAADGDDDDSVRENDEGETDQDTPDHPSGRPVPEEAGLDGDQDQ